MKNHILLCHSQTTEVNLFLPTVSQINTLYNVNTNDKSSSTYSMVFSKLIVADVKYSSFKIEDPLTLKDRVFSNGPVHSTFIYKVNMLLHIRKRRHI